VVYTGSATDATSYALLPKDDSRKMRLTSNAQAASIAAAIIARLQQAANKGSVNVPMNVGAEVWDYVSVVDSRLGLTKTGNQITLETFFSENSWDMSISFGKVARKGVIGTRPSELPAKISKPTTLATLGDLSLINDNLDVLFANQVILSKTIDKIIENLITAEDVAKQIITALSPYLPLSGGTMTGSVAMGVNKITGLAAATANGDAVRYEQLDVTQTDVTTSRAVSIGGSPAIYQNTTGKAITVAVTLTLYAAGDSEVAVAYCENDATPAVAVAECSSPTDLTNLATMTFQVPNGYYYEVFAYTGSPALVKWIEWS
jgi:hypothetical protein